MSHLVSSSPPISGAHTVKQYAGFGILGSAIPATGDNGGSPVLNDAISGTAEYYWRVETPPDAGTLTIYPDLSYELVGASDGVHPWIYRLFENGIDQGTATVTERVGVFPHLVGIAGSQQVNTAAAVAIKQTHKIGIASSQQAITAAAIAIRQTHKIGIANSQQTNTASAGSVSQSATIFVAATNSQQVNQASPVGIRQTHRISIANSQQTNTASPASAMQSGATFVAGSHSQQVSIASTAAVRQTHLISVGNSVQPNTATPVAIFLSGGGFSGSLSEEDVQRIAAAVLQAIASLQPTTISVVVENRDQIAADVWGFTL